MAEVQPTSPGAETAPKLPENGRVTTPKAGRHSRFTCDEDLIIVREVAAARAHIAGFGETRRKFENVAANVNENPSMNQKVTWKSVQDRYKRLQADFDKSDKRNQMMSGVGGEVGELEELLMEMREARDDMDSKKGADRAAQKAADEEKERVGQELVAASLKRKQADVEEIEVSTDDETPRKKRTSRRTVENAAEKDLGKFGKVLHDADLARISFEREKLDFERERFKVECEQRDLDRAERQKERETHQKLELEKFKLMMDAFRSK